MSVYEHIMLALAVMSVILALIDFLDNYGQK